MSLDLLRRASCVLRSTPESGHRAGYRRAKRAKGSEVRLALHVTPADIDKRKAVGRRAILRVVVQIQELAKDYERLPVILVLAALGSWTQGAYRPLRRQTHNSRRAIATKIRTIDAKRPQIYCGFGAFPVRDLERATRLELATACLGSKNSTTELRPLVGSSIT